MSTLYKGDTPLTHWTFLEDDGTLFPNLPTDTTKYAFHILDGSGIVRTHDNNAGAITNINTTAATLDLQLTATDTGATGVVSMWWVVTLSNGPRTFDAQRVLIQDPTQA